MARQLSAAKPGFRQRLLVAVGILGGLLAIGAACWWSYAQIAGYTAWQQALEDLDQNDLAAAKQQLRKCVASWPNDAEAHFYLARVCRRTADISGKEHLEAALRLGWPKEAIDLEQELVEAQFNDVRSVETALYSQLQVGHYDEIYIMEALAIGFLREHLLPSLVKCAGIWSDKYPHDWRPKYYWAYAYELGDDAEKAINRYRAVLELKPDHLEARRRLGTLLRRTGQPREAAQHLQYYHDRQPNNVESTTELARCFVMLAETGKARELLANWMHEHGDNNLMVLVTKAEVEIETAGPGAAIPWLRRAEQMAPQDHQVVTLLARSLREAGESTEAETYERRRDDIEKALRRLQEIFSVLLYDPDNIDVRYEAGTISMRLGKPKEGVRWFMSVLQIEPNHPGTHRALANYYESTGDKEKARDHRDTAEGKKRAIVH
jgi:Tfp pilus assembly protein PilF